MLRYILVIFAVLFSTEYTVYAQGELAQLQSCLLRATRGADPAIRDESKYSCVQQFSANISVERCAHVATQTEYTSTAEEIRKYCIFNLKADPTFEQCMTIARASYYGENGDEIRWQCLRLLAPNSPKRNCLRLSQSMVLPFNKRRAAEFCDMSY